MMDLGLINDEAEKDDGRTCLGWKEGKINVFAFAHM